MMHIFCYWQSVAKARQWKQKSQDTTKQANRLRATIEGAKIWRHNL